MVDDNIISGRAGLAVLRRISMRLADLTAAGGVVVDFTLAILLVPSCAGFLPAIGVVAGFKI